MMEKIVPSVYGSRDQSVSSSHRTVHFPVNAFLEETLKKEDEIKVILLAKKDSHGRYQQNIASFKEEFAEVNREIGALAEYVILDTDYSEKKTVHEQLLGTLVEELDTGSHIIADITYGPKDLPVVVFTALNFAEKFLDCRIDNIIYGKAEFADGKPVNTELCDMTPLYYLSSITNLVHCAEPEKARGMLRSLLSL